MCIPDPRVGGLDGHILGKQVDEQRYVPIHLSLRFGETFANKLSKDPLDFAALALA